MGHTPLGRTPLAAVLCALVALSARAEEATPQAAEPQQTDVKQPDQELPKKPELLLDCKPDQLLDPIEQWTPDCVAQWVINLGYDDAKHTFYEKKVDGEALLTLTADALQADHAIESEEARERILRSVKKILATEGSAGNFINWLQFLTWGLPLLGLYKYFTMRYEKEILRLTKKYNKWQEARTPAKAPEPLVTKSGQSEWIDGINSDVGGAGKPRVKKSKKVS